MAHPTRPRGFRAVCTPGMGILPMRNPPARHGQDAHATVCFRKAKQTLLIVYLLASACCVQGSESAQAGSFEAWQRHRDAPADPSLVRWYTFEDPKPDSTSTTNAAGEKNATLGFQPQQNRDSPLEELLIVEGRWPQKKGVRLDQRPLAAEPFVVANKSFTVEAWVRLIGLGTHRGNDKAPNGTLLSMGSGYWDGWRLTVSYPLRTLGFEIGRPKPSHSIGIGSGVTLSEGGWHHVAVTWDGREMRIFVDGMLAGSGPYDGEYTTTPEGAQFRVGYADHGVGSVKFDVDEISIHSRALSDAEILKAVEFCGPQAPGVQVNLAKTCEDRNDFAGARQHFRERLKSPSLGPRDRVSALFDLGDLCSRMRDPAGARDAYARIVAATNSSPADRCLAQLGIAASYVQQQNPGAAKQEFAKAGAMADAPPHLKQEASERAKELDRLQHGLPARDLALTRTQPPKLLRDGVALFVSPKGADTNPGTKEKPFATLERARDEIRARKTRNPESQTGKSFTVLWRISWMLF